MRLAYHVLKKVLRESLLHAYHRFVTSRLKENKIIGGCAGFNVIAEEQIMLAFNLLNILVLNKNNYNVKKN